MVDINAIEERLAAYADEQGTEGCDNLDELVHDTASCVASNVNNEGTQAQIRYLLSQNGPGAEEGIREALKKED